MSTLNQKLKVLLKDAQRTALLGVGSELRADDSAGLLVAAHLDELVKKSKPKTKIRIFVGATAPENLTGEIRSFKPTHLIIVDSADTGKRPGAFTLIEPEETAGISFCTHSLPLKIMLDYLNESFGAKFIIIGIQPKTLEFGKSPSAVVKKSAKLVAAAIESCLRRK